ncbi:MAG: hypothetical protein NTV01_14365 [Bacteroidia bacterium]|nr:hypothetical protein [Bacteroidia bacterium]
MNKLEIKFIGAVLDLKIELEGKEVGLYSDGTSEWTLTIEEFEIEGNLDLKLLCKGLNGTKWELEISVDGKGPKKYSGKIKNGYSAVKDEIQIPLN